MAALMGEHDQARATAPQTHAAPTPAPAPKHSEPALVAELRRQLSAGIATATYLRDSVMPSLERMSEGAPPVVATPDLAAWSALTKIEDVLTRTEQARGDRPFTNQVMEIPDILVSQRRWLQTTHDTLRPKIEALTKVIHAGATKPPAKPDPKNAPKQQSTAKPKQPEAPPVSYTANAAGPPSFDFGKVPPGKHQTLSIPIFNLVASPASAAVRYDGASSISLRSAPTHLYTAGTQLPDGAQHVVLQFVAPTARGTHRGTVRIDLSWGAAAKPETLTIPVIAHSMLENESTDDELEAERAPRRKQQTEDVARAKQVKQAEDELAAFDKAHPGHKDNGFDTKLDDVRDAMVAVGKQQKVGIDRAAREIMKYKKAPPVIQPNVVFELAMIALDIASAGVANAIAKGAEGGLKALSKAAAPKTVQLGVATIHAISDSLKEALKIASKHARAPSGSKTQPEPTQGTGANLSADPRVAFLEVAETENNLHEYERKTGLNHSAALLRPLLFKNSQAAIEALAAIEGSLKAELGHASQAYYTATIRGWFSLIAQLELDLNRVGSVDGKPIGPARGVVDIGFQAGASPRDRVIAKSAIMRGVSNAAATPLWQEPLLRAGVPIRVYGVPSPNHAELLVTVTRNAAGTVEYIDQTNGAAPGSGQWLKRRGGGDARAGAELLLKDILSTSLESQKLPVTTDQDPSLEGG
jgi:hypothetical protein